MLYEYAVDPELFGTLVEFKLWSERFGIPCARLIAQYPRDWKKKAVAWAKKRESAPVLRHSLIERIRRLDESKFIDLQRMPYEERVSWLENVAEQRKSSPFHCVIARRNPNNMYGVLIGETVFEDTPAFAVNTDRKVPRTAQDMAACVRLILRASQKVVFVDPYFHPSEKRFNQPLQAFLFEAVQGIPLQSVEYHLCGDLKNSAPLEGFRRACESSLPKIVPEGVQLKLVRWREKEKKESLHPRYILTDICGISFEHGLDEETEHQTTDVRILSASVYCQTCAQYDPTADVFEKMDETIIIGQAL